MTEDIPWLEGPYEFLLLANGEEKTFHVLKWEYGRAVTHPPWLPEGQTIVSKVLRMHLPRTEKPLFPFYYDFGQKTLVPQLLTLLPQATLERSGITIRAVGEGAKKRFSVGLEVRIEA